MNITHFVIVMLRSRIADKQIGTKNIILGISIYGTIIQVSGIQNGERGTTGIVLGLDGMFADPHKHRHIYYIKPLIKEGFFII